MRVHRFWFDGRCCTDFGIICSGSGTWNAPARDVTPVEIPGRNGVLLLDNGRYKNIPVAYPAFIHRRFANNAAAARAWLLAGTGYRRLEDDYHPEEYRLARFSGPLEFEAHFLNRSGEMTLEFDCKPQRYSKAGDRPIQLSQSGTSLHNPYAFTALPCITVYGSGPGNLQVGSTTVQIKALDGSLTLDSEIQDAYKIPAPGQPAQNKNNTIFAPEFPALAPGDNTVSWTGGIERVEVVPRWWTI